MNLAAPRLSPEKCAELRILVLEQFVRRTLFGDASVIEDDDAVAGEDRPGPVRDDEGRQVAPCAQRSVQVVLAVRIEVGGGLIENEDGGASEKCAGEGHPCTLPAGEPISLGISPIDAALKTRANRDRFSPES